MANAWVKVGEKGNRLRKAFDYITRFSYISGSKNPTGNWSVKFAKEMFKNNGGNCYRFAAAFCWMAKSLGYDARVVRGYVPSASQGLAPHGWVEIKQGSKVYVCDPDLNHELPGHNWYMFTYATAPTTYTKG